MAAIIKNIEQIRAQLASVNHEIKSCREAGLALAADSTSSREQLQAKADELEGLKTRAAMLKEAMDEAMDAQSQNVTEMKASVDGVQAAASKFKSAGDFYSVVARASNRENPVVDPRLAEYLNVRSAATGQNLTTDSEGGYLVPPDYAAELLNVAQSESVLLPKVSRIPISSNRLIVNEVEQETRKDGSPEVKGRNGGLLAYWTAEAGDYTPTKMKFKQNQTDLHKLTGLCYATEEMLEDLPALGSYIAQGFSDEFAFKIDDGILNGTGSGMPQGILHSGNGALVTIAKETAQEKATVVLNNILKMFNAMPARNRQNAEWYINQDLEIVLMQILMNTGSIEAGDTIATFGKPLYVPAGGLASAPNGMILGRPIVPVEQAGALGSMGDISFTDMSQYRWIDRGGVNAQTSLHVRFLQDEMAFKFTYRCGGKPIWSSSISAYKGETKRSPYVTLAERA